MGLKSLKILLCTAIFAAITVLPLEDSEAQRRGRKTRSTSGAKCPSVTTSAFAKHLSDLKNVCNQDYKKTKKGKRPRLKTIIGDNAANNIERYQKLAASQVKQSSESLKGTNRVSSAAGATQGIGQELKKANEKSWGECGKLKKHLELLAQPKECSYLLSRHRGEIIRVMSEGKKKLDAQQLSVDDLDRHVKDTEKAVTVDGKHGSPNFGKAAKGNIHKGDATFYGYTKGQARRVARGGHVYTADGRLFRPDKDLTAASNYFPLGSQVEVSTPSGKSVVVTITDLGQFRSGTVIDLSRRAFGELAPLGRGVIKDVVVKRIYGIAPADKISIAADSPNKDSVKTGEGQIFQIGNEEEAKRIERMIASHEFCEASTKIKALAQGNIESLYLSDKLKNKLDDELESAGHPSGETGLSMICP